MMQFKTVQAYWDHLRHILAQKGFVSESHKIQLSPISKRKRIEGVITADDITFQDGATLRFLENVTYRDFLQQNALKIWAMCITPAGVLSLCFSQTSISTQLHLSMSQYA